jgi:chromosome segregation ATPase
MRCQKNAPGSTLERNHMMTSEFNAIDFTNELQSTGVPKEQATVHANALTKILAEVAFARDLTRLESNLRKEIRECEERLSIRIDSVRTELGARLSKVEAELGARLTKLETELGARLTKLEAELRAEIGAVRAEITVLRAEIGALRNELVLHRWALGLIAAIGMTNLALTLKLILS